MKNEWIELKIYTPTEVCKMNKTGHWFYALANINKKIVLAEIHPGYGIGRAPKDILSIKEYKKQLKRDNSFYSGKSWDDLRKDVLADILNDAKIVSK